MNSWTVEAVRDNSLGVQNGTDKCLPSSGNTVLHLTWILILKLPAL